MGGPYMNQSNHSARSERDDVPSRELFLHSEECARGRASRPDLAHITRSLHSPDALNMAAPQRPLALDLRGSVAAEVQRSAAAFAQWSQLDAI
jgi:hypothetical protein